MGTLVLTGATSGSATLTPVDAVTAVITLPSATATLATLGANTFVGNQAITGTLSTTSTAVIGSSTNGQLQLNNAGGNNAASLWFSGASVASGNKNWVINSGDFAGSVLSFAIANSAGGVINSAATEVVRLTSGGLSVTGTLSATGAISPLALLDISGASAGQIKFPATQNASANANTLDDYEEGTWTPVIVNMTVVGAQTNSGKYTKIGNIVYFAAFVSAATSITWSASAIIDGLPYVGLAVPNGIASMRNNDSTQNLQGSDYSGVQNAPDFVNSRFFVGNFIATGAGVRIDFSGFYFVAT
jgi:hypothetical protein